MEVLFTFNENGSIDSAVGHMSEQAKLMLENQACSFGMTPLAYISSDEFFKTNGIEKPVEVTNKLKSVTVDYGMRFKDIPGL